MADELDYVARLLAFHRRRAVVKASHLQTAIQSDAIVLCPVAMAGEDTTTHIVACGIVGQPATLYSVPDPRNRDAQYNLFEWLLTKVESHFEACDVSGRYPQIWVSSGAAVIVFSRLPI